MDRYRKHQLIFSLATVVALCVFTFLAGAGTSLFLYISVLALVLMPEPRRFMLERVRVRRAPVR